MSALVVSPDSGPADENGQTGDLAFAAEPARESNWSFRAETGPAQAIRALDLEPTEAQLLRARAALRREKRSDILRILYVGRLLTARNVGVLLRAVASIKLPVRRVECTIVGEGPERSNLETRAIHLGLSNRVTFAGDLSFDRLLDYYEQAHLLVLDADAEDWSRNAAGAVAFGLLCMAIEDGMMRDALGEWRGMLAPSWDIDALKAAMHRAANAGPGEAPTQPVQLL